MNEITGSFPLKIWNQSELGTESKIIGRGQIENVEGDNNFKNTLNKLIREVDNLEKKSDATIKGFAIGEVTDIHEVTIAVEEAQIAFNLLLEIRNKLLETYQEVMRMQV